MIRKYETKPEQVQAVQFTGLNFDEVEAFVGGDVGKGIQSQLVVASPDGALPLTRWCWIVKSKLGRYCVLSDAAFRELYELI